MTGGPDGNESRSLVRKEHGNGNPVPLGQAGYYIYIHTHIYIYAYTVCVWMIKPNAEVSRNERRTRTDAERVCSALTNPA